eukprot:scaffold17510_cov18-Tisochrysis_lutea.AAC.2
MHVPTAVLDGEQIPATAQGVGGLISWRVYVIFIIIITLHPRSVLRAWPSSRGATRRGRMGQQGARAGALCAACGKRKAAVPESGVCVCVCVCVMRWRAQAVVRHLTYTYTHTRTHTHYTHQNRCVTVVHCACTFQAMAASALRDPAAFFGHSLFPSQSTILELADNEVCVCAAVVLRCLLAGAFCIALSSPA